MLGPYRVLDLTNERGLVCGQMLADLGADVIAVEPPGGNRARRLGPFAGDVHDPERSLYWWAYARNKRSITADLRHDAGRALLARLVATADFLIESENPGVLAGLGLDPRALAALNPRLVTVSITPFGQDGPRARWVDSDLILLAAGGPLVLMGDADRPPARLPVPQAYLHAAADGAVGALIAHHARVRTGQGQHVDVSAQQSVALATQSYILSVPWEAPEVERQAGGLKNGPLTIRLLFPAADGHVAITFLFGSAIGPFSRRLMEWVFEEGGCDATMRDKDWIGYSQLLLSGAEPLTEFERVKETIARFTGARSKAVLLEAALVRGLLIAPVARLDEVVGSAQLHARDYWQTAARPDGEGTYVHPGPFARCSATPLLSRRRPPRIGEHNREIYGRELGLDDAALARLAGEGAI